MLQVRLSQALWKIKWLKSKAELWPCADLYYTASLSKVGSATSHARCERALSLKPLSIHGSRTPVVVIRENLLRYKKFSRAIKAWRPPPLPLRLPLAVDMWQIDEWTNYPTSSTQDRRHSRPSEIKAYLILFCQPSVASKSSGRSRPKPLGTNMAVPFISVWLLTQCRHWKGFGLPHYGCLNSGSASFERSVHHQKAGPPKD